MKIKFKRKGNQLIENINLKVIFIIVGIVSTIFLISQGMVRNGLEYIFMLPLTFSLCVLAFGDIIDYHNGGVGLKVFYSVIVIRYIISPVLIVLTEGAKNPHMIDVSSNSNRLSVIIISCELVIACLTIKLSWKKCLAKAKKTNIKYKRNIKGLSIWGVIFIGLLGSFILLRANRFFPSMGILFIKEPSADLGSFEAIFIRCFKSLLFVLTLIWVKNTRKKSDMIFYNALVFLAVFFNIAIYFGSNRSFILQTAITTIFIYLAAFPNKKKIAIIFLVPISIIIVSTMFVKKQFGVELSSYSEANVSISEVSNIAESYTNGIWPMASILDASTQLRSEVTLGTPIKDTVMGFFPTYIPGLSWIRDCVSSLKSTPDIYMDYLYPWNRGAMVTLSGQMWMYGGKYFGWILAIIANIVMVYLLVRVETLGREVEDLKYKYLYVWLSSLFGLIMCYCAITILWCWSQFGLFYHLLLKVNDSRFIRKR
ncbi:hypothetical protein [Clostridium perfringens]|uniref:hypothetical protein n=1 Tax=Clostridium perfringens TaxID=1502 RepID=UPI0032DB02D5